MIVKRENATHWTLIAENHLERDGLAWLLEKLQKACSAVDTSDRGLLKRLLADMEQCGRCKVRPVTKRYFVELSSDTETEFGMALCCDECVDALEAETKAEGASFSCRDTENAALVRELVAKVGVNADPGS